VLAFAAVTVALQTTCDVAVSAEKAIELRFAHMFPASSPSGQLAEAWASKVSADSNGRLTVRIFPVGTLIPPPEMYDGVASGAADVCLSFRYLPKGNTVGVTLPFILGAPDTVTAGRVYDDLWKKFPKVMADEWKEVKILWLAPSQFQVIATRKPVRGLDDLKGLQLRVPSKEMGEMVKELGGTPVYMSVPDFIVGIEKGTVDGCVILPAAVQDNKLAGKLKYILDVSMGVSVPVMAIMNKDTFNRLPADLQAVIEKYNQWGKEATTKLWVEAYEENLKYFKAEGIEVIRPTPQEKARILAIVERVRDRVGADLDSKGYPGTEIVRFIRERVEQYSH
jgi:TRAP-type C4-dicarboxylate transport system substrate-binding protein